MRALKYEKLSAYWQKLLEPQKNLVQEKEEKGKEEQKFLETQYAALRTEIEQASERAFKIFAASVLVVPTGLTLGGVASAGNNVLPLIKMLLPLLLLAFYAMYSAQMFSTRRAGLYIESHIEPRLLIRTRGWESWLSGRRYAYDAQMDFAFFSLSAVYYLGTVYIAVTSEVAGTPLLKHFQEFLDFRNQLLHIPSSERMLFILYLLAGLGMFFWVQLVPRMQLKEEERIEQRSRKVVPGTPEEVQATFINKLKERKVNQKYDIARFVSSGQIKSYHCDTETARHVPKARHVRLTIGAGLKNTTTVVGITTLILLLLWAEMPIHRLHHRLAHPPLIAVEWMQPPSVIMVLTVVSLLLLLGLLFTSYYYPIGRNVGAKIDIRFRPAKLPANGDGTRYIVQSSLDEEDYEWLTKMVEGETTAIEEDKTKPEEED